MSSVTQKRLRVDISEIKRRASLLDIWTALGGGELHGNRGRAFWRSGDGLSVSLDPQHGLWFDHARGDGGDVVSLVRTVRQCSFPEAAEWLADFTGVRRTTCNVSFRDAGNDFDWATDLKWAQWWGMMAVVLAEHALESLDCCDPARRDLTALLTHLRLGEASLVSEYRRWRHRSPRLTAAMAWAGQRSDARMQRKLALWIVRSCG